MRAERKAWVIAADMGYGHQRAAYPLKDIAYDRILNANSHNMISEKEKKFWNKIRAFYEWISRMTSVPLIGKLIFNIFNTIQSIEPYYPRMLDKSPNLQSIVLEKQIRKGLCLSVIRYIRTKELPVITTFYIPGIALNYYKIPNSYCVVTDTDINRVWVPKNPETNMLTYLAPCQHAYNRLVSYGVKQEQIIITGFPLPKECVGKKSEIAKRALSKRLTNLDPHRKFLGQHEAAVREQLKGFSRGSKASRVTITFVVGGAAAQKEIGAQIMRGLKQKIHDGKIRLLLAAGTHLDVKDYYEDEAKRMGLSEEIGKGVVIMFALKKKDYFEKFSALLNETDILWTKPSEMSFYCALGLPVIISPHIGAQEYWNRKWLLEVGAGVDQEDPRYVDKWLEEWLSQGLLARKAWQGFLNAPRMGTYEIERVVLGRK